MRYAMWSIVLLLVVGCGAPPRDVNITSGAVELAKIEAMHDAFLAGTDIGDPDTDESRCSISCDNGSASQTCADGYGCRAWCDTNGLPQVACENPPDDDEMFEAEFGIQIGP